MRNLIYPIVIFFYMISTLFPEQFILYTVGVFANIAIIISIFYASGIFLYSGIFFYMIAIILFGLGDFSWEEYFLQFDTMLGMLALFLLLPFLSSLIHIGKYDKQLSNLIKWNTHHLGDLYIRSSLTTFVISLFLNIATIPLIIDTLKRTVEHFPRQVQDKFLSRSILRAYMLCLMWNPMEILIIQAITMTQIEYIFIFPILISFSLFLLLFDSFYNKRKYISYSIKALTADVSLKTIYLRLLELFIFLAILISLITLLNYILQEGYLFSLIILIIPLSFVWAIKLGKLKRFLRYSIPLWKKRTDDLANYFFMFLCAGFFVNMVKDTYLVTIMQNLFITYHEQTLFLYTFIGIYFFIIAMIGFHPFVAIVLLAEILAPILPDISSVSLAFLLIITSLSSVVYSPFNVSISLLAAERNLSSVTVGSYNIIFVIGLIFISIFIAYSLNLVSTLLGQLF